jgi:hypothetical protein
MGIDDFLDWRDRQETPRGPVHRAPVWDERPPAREEPAKPSEPLEVHEFDGSTTIVERIRQAIAKRFNGG